MEHYFFFSKQVGSNLVTILLTVISIAFQRIYIIDSSAALQYNNGRINFYEVPHKDSETLIIASVQTLKRNNKKCGKKEVLRLVQQSVKSKITKEIFEERLVALAESHSVKIKLLGTPACLSLLKLNQDSNNKESSDETLANNDTLAISENEELIKLKKEQTFK